MNQSAHSTVSSATRPVNPAVSVDELIQRSLHITNNDKIEEIRKQTNLYKESMNRYKSETLSIQRHSENIIGRTLETYDVEIQTDKFVESYSSEEENQKMTDKENHKRSVVASAKSKVQTSNKKGFELDEKKNYEKGEEKETKRFVINDDYRRQILNSSELSEFLVSKSKYIERVIGFVYIGSW